MQVTNNLPNKLFEVCKIVHKVNSLVDCSMDCIFGNNKDAFLKNTL